MCCFLCLIIVLTPLLFVDFFSFFLFLLVWWFCFYLIVHNYLSFVLTLTFVVDRIVVVVAVESVIDLVALCSFDDDVVESHVTAMNDVPKPNEMHQENFYRFSKYTWTSSVVNLFDEDFFIVSSRFC